MIKMVCDRCGEEIKGTTYYTIDIHGNDINPRTEYTVYAETAVQNVQTNLLSAFNARKQYCKECRDDIEEFICRRIYKNT